MSAHHFDPANGLKLKVDVTNRYRPYTLLEPLRYVHGAINETIPAGFQCDLTSIPVWFWSIPGFSPIGRHIRAGLVHDHLYRVQTTDRDIADAVFKAICRHDGVPWRVRWAMYLAVRFFGQAAWDANAEELRNGKA